MNEEVTLTGTERQVSRNPFKEWPTKKLVKYIVGVVVVMIILIPVFNAAKYDALVQVIAEDKIGVNPTAEKLDFGDLPRNKTSARNVTLENKGSMGSYIIVWKFGDISDLIRVSKNYFTLQSNTTEKLEFNISIPNSAEYRYYRGRVIIFQIPKFW